MAAYGNSLEGCVLCRPCAVTLGYLPATQVKRCCPFPCNGPAPKSVAKFANCPWRNPEDARAVLHGRCKQLLDEKLAELVDVPQEEREAKTRDISAEVQVLGYCWERCGVEGLRIFMTVEASTSMLISICSNVCKCC